jgi:hypothetical protein
MAVRTNINSIDVTCDANSHDYLRFHEFDSGDTCSVCVSIYGTESDVVVITKDDAKKLIVALSAWAHSKED